MLGSGDEPDPVVTKKVEHRDKILYNESTPTAPEGEISMLNKDYTSKLLGLEDVIITNVEKNSNELHIYLELPRAEHRCPACGTLTNRIHDYRMQAIKDVSLARNTFLPRYYCVTGQMVSTIPRVFEKLVSTLRFTPDPLRKGKRCLLIGLWLPKGWRFLNFKTAQRHIITDLMKLCILWMFPGLTDALRAAQQDQGSKKGLLRYAQLP